MRHRLAVVGNAAHRLHPVAGQGFNLTLRDCRDLATRIGEAARRGQDVGAFTLLQSYSAARRRDQLQVIDFSDSVIRLFGSYSEVVAALRNLGLAGMELLPTLKGWFVRRAMGEQW